MVLHCLISGLLASCKATTTRSSLHLRRINKPFSKLGRVDGHSLISFRKAPSALASYMEQASERAGRLSARTNRRECTLSRTPVDVSDLTHSRPLARPLGLHKAWRILLAFFACFPPLSLSLFSASNSASNDLLLRLQLVDLADTQMCVRKPARAAAAAWTLLATG